MPNKTRRLSSRLRQLDRTKSRRLIIESLESRQVLAGVLAQYGTPDVNLIGGWDNFAQQSVSTEASGKSVANWTFLDLPKGQYQLAANWSSVTGATTSANYQVFDGVARVVSVAVDQSQNSQGQQVHNGANYQFISQPFEVNSGSVSVELSSFSNGKAIAGSLLLSRVQPVVGESLLQATFGGSSAVSSLVTETLVGDQLLVVDSSRQYNISAEVRGGNGSSGYDPNAKHFLGFISYDFRGNQIETENFAKVSGSVDTRLAVSLQPGQTQIVLENASGWGNSANSDLRGLAWYGADENNSSVVYSDYGYTRNVRQDLWAAGGINGNTIQLRSPWAGPTLAAGSPVRNAISGGFSYPLINNSSVGSNWTKLSATVQNTSSIDNPSHQSFPPGTVSIRPVMHTNLNSNQGSQVQVRDFKISSAVVGTFNAGDTVQLNASLPSTQGLQVRWQQLSGPSVNLSSSTLASTSFTIPQIAIETGFEFLIATIDQTGVKTTAQVSLRALPQTQVPATASLFRASFQGGNSISASDTYQIIRSDNDLLIDPSRQYQIKAVVQGGDDQGQRYNPKSLHYVGFESYDAQGNLIQLENFRRVSGSLDTTLAQPLVTGATSISLQSSTGWHNGSTSSWRNIAWFDPGTNTYTPNLLLNAWLQGAISGNTITLSQPWSGPNLAAGTLVRNTVNGLDNYPLLKNQAVTVGESLLNATLSGIATAAASLDTQFMPGASRVRPIIRANIQNAPGNRVTVQDFEIAPAATSGYRPGDTVQLHSNVAQLSGLTVSWIQTGGPSVTLSSTLNNDSQFQIPYLFDTTNFEFEAIVADQFGNSSRKSLSVVGSPTVIPFSQVPLSQTEVQQGASVSLGIIRDPNASGSVTWTQESGPTAVITTTQNGANIQVPTTAFGEKYRFKAQITNGNVSTDFVYDFRTADSSSVPNGLTGDFNRDGSLDYLKIANNSLVVSYVDETNQLKSESWGPYDLTGQPIIGDFNGDNRDDLLMVRSVVNSWTLARSLGDTFSIGSISVSPPLDSVQRILVGDFNGDLRDDLAVWNSQNRAWSVGVSDGVSIRFETWHTVQDNFTFEKAELVDLNGDGTKDIVMRPTNSSSWRVLYSNGNGFSTATVPSQGAFSSDAVIGDFDGNGLEDLAYRNGSTWKVTRRNADGAIQTSTWLATSTNLTSVIASDLDGDGDADLHGLLNGQSRVLRSTGSAFILETWNLSNGSPWFTNYLVPGTDRYLSNLMYRSNTLIREQEFVTNELDFIPGKGIDRSFSQLEASGYGNAWEQAALLQSKLNGIVDSTVRTGRASIAPTQMETALNWLHADSVDQAYSLLEQAQLNPQLQGTGIIAKLESLDAIPENGGTNSIQVKLNAAPTSNVYIDVTLQNGTRPQSSPGVQVVAPNPYNLVSYFDFDENDIPNATYDRIGGQLAVLNGAVLTTAGGGRTGTNSDRALDVRNGAAIVNDTSFLDAIAGDDKITISFWQRLDTLRQAPAFYAVGESQERGIGIFPPWTDNVIYFDSSGCCAASQRQSVSSPAGATGSWRHYAFVKDGSTKQIYVNGVLTATATNAAPLLTDFSKLVLGGFPQGATVNGLLDDVAIFSSVLTASNISGLASGTRADQLGGIGTSSLPQSPTNASTIVDLVASTNRLTFNSTNWNQPQTITLTAQNNTWTDSNRNANVLLSVSNDSATSFADLDQINIPVAIKDDDTKPAANLVVDQTENTTYVRENGESDSLTLKLANQPSGTVIVSATVNNSSELSLTQSHLVFTPWSWNQPKSLSVSAINDTIEDGLTINDITFTIISSEDPNFVVGTGLKVKAAAQDNDSGFTIVDDTDSTNFEATSNFEQTGMVVLPLGDSPYPWVPYYFYGISAHALSQTTLAGEYASWKFDVQPGKYRVWKYNNLPEQIASNTYSPNLQEKYEVLDSKGDVLTMARMDNHFISPKNTNLETAWETIGEVTSIDGYLKVRLSEDPRAYPPLIPGQSSASRFADAIRVQRVYTPAELSAMLGVPEVVGGNNLQPQFPTTQGSARSYFLSTEAPSISFDHAWLEARVGNTLQEIDTSWSVRNNLLSLNSNIAAFPAFELIDNFASPSSRLSAGSGYRELPENSFKVESGRLKYTSTESEALLLVNKSASAASVTATFADEFYGEDKLSTQPVSVSGFYEQQYGADPLRPLLPGRNSLVGLLQGFDSAEGSDARQTITSLNLGQSINAKNGRYELRLESNGNLKISDLVKNDVIWETETSDVGVSSLTLRADGNLVLLKTDGTIAWESETDGNQNAILFLGDDGRLRIESEYKTELWASDSDKDRGNDQQNRFYYSARVFGEMRVTPEGRSYIHNVYLKLLRHQGDKTFEVASSLLETLAYPNPVNRPARELKLSIEDGVVSVFVNGTRKIDYHGNSVGGEGMFGIAGSKIDLATLSYSFPLSTQNSSTLTDVSTAASPFATVSSGNDLDYGQSIIDSGSQSYVDANDDSLRLRILSQGSTQFESALMSFNAISDDGITLVKNSSGQLTIRNGSSVLATLSNSSLVSLQLLTGERNSLTTPNWSLSEVTDLSNVDLAVIGVGYGSRGNEWTSTALRTRSLAKSKTSFETGAPIQQDIDEALLADLRLAVADYQSSSVPQVSNLASTGRWTVVTAKRPSKVDSALDVLPWDVRLQIGSQRFYTPGPITSALENNAIRLTIEASRSQESALENVTGGLAIAAESVFLAADVQGIEISKIRQLNGGVYHDENSGRTGRLSQLLSYPPDYINELSTKLDSGLLIVVPSRPVSFHGRIATSYVAIAAMSSSVYEGNSFTTLFEGLEASTIRGSFSPTPHSGRVSSGTAGQLIFQAGDIQLDSIGQEINFTRAYNSQFEGDMGLGQGWAHQYGQHLELQKDGSFRWITQTGQPIQFNGDGSQYHVPYNFSGGSVTRTGVAGSYIYTLKSKSGDEYEFRQFSNTGARFTKQSDRNGNQILVAYSGSNILSISDLDNSGQNRVRLSFEYSGSKISKITDSAGRQWLYSYESTIDNKSNLTTVKGPRANLSASLISTYDYHASGPGKFLLKSITVADGAVESYDYDQFKRLIIRTNPEGDMRLFRYIDYRDEVISIDERGKETVDRFDSSGLLTSRTSPNGLVEQYRWNPSSQTLSSTIAANGAITSFEYDEKQNLTKKIDPSGLESRYTYDPNFSVVLSVTQDPSNSVSGDERVTTTQIDSRGNIVAIVDAEGKVESRTFSARGLELTRTSKRGTSSPATNDFTKTKSYDSFGRVTQVTYADENSAVTSSSFVYDSIGNMISKTDQTGIVTQWTYDNSGNILTTSLPSPTPQSTPLVTQVSYDAAGRKIREIDGEGRARQWRYDKNGRVIAEVNFDGSSKQFEYDASGNQIATTNELGIRTLYRFDNLNQKVKTTFEDGATETSEYDSSGNITKKTNANDATTTFSYDLSGKMLATVDPLGGTKANSYNKFGEISSTVDELGLTTVYEYDKNGRRTTERVGNSLVIATTYDADGNPVSITEYDIRGLAQPPANLSTLPTSRIRTTTNSFNSANKVIQTIDSTGAITTTVRDAEERIVASTDALGRTTNYIFDSAGRSTGFINPPAFPGMNRSTTLLSLDKVGNTVQSMDANGNIQLKKFDSEDRLIEATDAEGYSTRYYYDVLGNLTVEIDERGAAIRKRYDKSGWMIQSFAADPDGSGPAMSIPDRFEWDKVGNKISSTDALGRKTVLFYDANNNLVRELSPSLIDGDETSRLISQTSYDAKGNVIESINRLGFKTTYTYDASGFLVSTQGPDPDALGPLQPKLEIQTFNGFGDIVSKSDEQGRVTNYEYDRLGRLIRQVSPDPDGAGPGIAPTQSWTYDAAGNKTLWTNPRGIATKYDYDGLDRLYVTTLLHSSGNTLLDLREYDAVGNLIASTDAKGNRTTIEYDGLNRPISKVFPRTLNSKEVTQIQTEYDPAGNITAVVDQLGRRSSLVYDFRGLLIASTLPSANEQDSPELTIEYDPAGNKVASTDTLGRKTNYQIDSLNRVIGVTISLGEQTNTKQFGYDAAGNLTFTIDAAGRVSTTVFDALNRKIREEYPSHFEGQTRGVVQTVYTQSGKVGVTIDQAGRQTLNTYDALDRLIRTTSPDPDGSGPLPAPFTEYKYDTNNNVLSTTDQLGRVTTTAYDIFDRKTRTEQPDPDGTGPLTAPVTWLYYDLNGNITSEMNAMGRTTTYQYDELDRLTLKTLPDPVLTDAIPAPMLKYSYDQVGNIVSTTDALGQTTQFVYDEQNHVIRKILPDPIGEIPVGNMSRQQVAGVVETLGLAMDTSSPFNLTGALEHWFIGKNSIRFSLRPDGVLRQWNNTIGSSDGPVVARFGSYYWQNILEVSRDNQGNPIVVSSYDSEGNLASTTDELGKATTYTYDSLNRLIRTETSNPNQFGPLVVETYSYDAVGNVISTTDGLGRTTHFEYDDLNRLTKTYLPDPSIAPDSVSRIQAKSMVEGLGLTNVSTKDQDNLLAAKSYGEAKFESDDIVGQALTINGGNDRLQVDNAGNLSNTSGEFSLALWVKLDQSVTGSQKLITSRGDSLNDSSYSLMVNPNTNTVRYSVKNSTGLRTRYSLQQLQVGQWTHLVLVKSANAVELYWNGQLDSSISSTGLLAETSAPINIGAASWGTGFVGSIADYRLLRRAVSAAEAMTLKSIATIGLPDLQIQGGLPDQRSTEPKVNWVGGASISVDASFGTVVDIASRTSSLEIGRDSKLDWDGFDNDSTLSFWFKPLASSDGTWRTVLGKGNSSTDRDFWLYLNPTSNRIGVSLRTASGVQIKDTNTILNLGEWSFISLVRNGNELRILINGVLDSTISINSTPTTSSAPLFIGKTPWSNAAISKLDDLKAFNHSLTNEQIQAIYQSKQSLRAIASFDFGSRWISDVSSNSYYLSSAGSFRMLAPGTNMLQGNSLRFGSHYWQNPQQLVNPIEEVVSEQRSYDVVGNLLSIVDVLGRVTQYTYDDLDRQISESRPDPILNSSFRPTKHTRYDSSGNVSEEQDFLGRVTLYQYDRLDRQILATLPDPDGTSGPLVAPTLASSYDSLSNVISTTDHLGLTTSYTYDRLNRRIRITYPDADLTDQVNAPSDKFTYDDNDNLTSETNALGRVTTYTYNRLGQKSSVTKPLITGQPLSIVRYSYDPKGNLLAETDELGRVTRWTYDTWGRNTSELSQDPDAAGPLIAPAQYFTYDVVSNLVATSDQIGRVSLSSYDGLDRQISHSEADPDGMGTMKSPTSTYEYDLAGNMTASVDPLGNRTTFVYDRWNRKIEERQPGTSGWISNGPTSRWEYDLAGNVRGEIDQLGKRTTYAFDNLDRLTSVVSPPPDTTGPHLYAETQHVYNDAGYEVSERQRVSNASYLVTSFEYDRRGRQIKTVDAGGSETRFTYDNADNLRTIVDGSGNTTSYAYDAQDRLLSTTNSLGKTRSYKYDPAGNVIEMVDRLGRKTRYVYDGLNRTIQENWIDSNGTTSNSIAFGFDNSGSTISSSDSSFVYQYGNDLLGRQTSFTRLTPANSIVAAFNYQIDAAGNLTSRQETSGGESIVDLYTYNSLNQLTTHKQSGTNLKPKRANYTYDATGLFDLVSRFEDTEGVQLVTSSKYSYDNSHRLAGIRHFESNTTLLDYNLTYDLADRVNSLNSTTDGLSSYQLDSTGQLLSADHTSIADEAYSYDANGNRIGNGIVVGANNQTLSDGNYNYVYDFEGNRSSRTRISDGIQTHYEWDYRNRLTSVAEYTSASGSLISRVSYIYDANDLRIERRVDSNGDGSIDQTEQFIYDGKILTSVLNGANQTLQRFLNGPSVDQVLAVEGTADEVLWPLADHLGTAKSLAKSVDGVTQIGSNRSYDAFGSLISESNSSIDYLFGFSGREFDEATGLANHRSRWYDPKLGDFVGEDPIGFAAGDANLTRYVGNSPLDAVDPTGTDWWDFAFGLVGSYAVNALNNYYSRSTSSDFSYSYAGFSLGYSSSSSWSGSSSSYSIGGYGQSASYTSGSFLGSSYSNFSSSIGAYGQSASYSSSSWLGFSSSSFSYSIGAFGYSSSGTFSSGSGLGLGYSSSSYSYSTPSYTYNYGSNSFSTSSLGSFNSSFSSSFSMSTPVSNFGISWSSAMNNSYGNYGFFAGVDNLNTSFAQSFGSLLSVGATLVTDGLNLIFGNSPIDQGPTDRALGAVPPQFDSKRSPESQLKSGDIMQSGDVSLRILSNKESEEIMNQQWSDATANADPSKKRMPTVNQLIRNSESDFAGLRDQLSEVGFSVFADQVNRNMTRESELLTVKQDERILMGAEMRKNSEEEMLVRNLAKLSHKDPEVSFLLGQLGRSQISPICWESCVSALPPDSHYSSEPFFDEKGRGPVFRYFKETADEYAKDKSPLAIIYGTLVGPAALFDFTVFNGVSESASNAKREILRNIETSNSNLDRYLGVAAYETAAIGEYFSYYALGEVQAGMLRTPFAISRGPAIASTGSVAVNPWTTAAPKDFVYSNDRFATILRMPILNPHFTPNQTVLNKVTAYDFYTGKAGMSPTQALGHMGGIDFTRSVSVVNVPYGTIAQQYVGPSGVGSYYSGLGASELQVGIKPTGNLPSLFQTMSDTPALRSFSMPDYIYPPGAIVPGSGAGNALQYFIPNKSVMVQIVR